jgi:hypothetical protein
MNTVGHNARCESNAPRLLRWLLISLLITANSSPAQSSVPEYKLKAVFLFRFSQYVEWPEKVFKDQQPFVIGILGADPFDGFIDETVQGESVKGHPAQVRRFKSLDEISNCHILYVSGSAAARLPEVLAKVKGRPILTVSDIPNFATRGGMIRFTRNGPRIGFRINVDASKQSHLTISAKLLQMAEIVSPEK